MVVCDNEPRRSLRFLEPSEVAMGYTGVSLYFNKTMYYHWFTDLLRYIHNLNIIKCVPWNMSSACVFIVDNVDNDSPVTIKNGYIANKCEWLPDETEPCSFNDILANIFNFTCLSNRYEEKIRVSNKYEINCSSSFLHTWPNMLVNDPIIAAKMEELCGDVPNQYKEMIVDSIVGMCVPGFFKNYETKHCAPHIQHDLHYTQMWLIDQDDALYYINTVFTEGLRTVIDHFEQRCAELKAEAKINPL